MGFVNVAAGCARSATSRRDELPAGPVALVSHSGSAFSALLRSHRRLGFSLAVSSGQELVTTAADYLDAALGRSILDGSASLADLAAKVEADDLDPAPDLRRPGAARGRREPPDLGRGLTQRAARGRASMAP